MEISTSVAHQTPVSLDIVAIGRNALCRVLTQLLTSSAYKSNASAMDTCVAIHGNADRLQFRTAWADLNVVIDLPPAGDLAETWVPARALLDCARSVAGDVLLTRGKDRLVVEAKDARFEVVTVSPDPEKPRPVPDPLLSGVLTVTATDLRKIIDRVLPYVAPDENRYGLNGMSWEYADGALLAVATDGYRLGRATVPASGSLAKYGKALLPVSLFAVFKGLDVTGYVRFTFAQTTGIRPNKATKADEEYISATHFRAEWDGGLIQARMVMADFPDWRQAIPATYPNAITVDRDALMVAVRRGGKFARDFSRSVRVTVGDGGLTFESRDVDRGSAKSTVPAGVIGERRVFGLNQGFLLAALRTLPGGPVEIGPGVATLSPCRVRSLVEPTVEAIVMPVRLD